jgi:hypothetical protein
MSMFNFKPAFVGRGKVVHAMHTSPDSHRVGKTACGREAATESRSCDAGAKITCRACQDALPSWINVGPLETPKATETREVYVAHCMALELDKLFGTAERITRHVDDDEGDTWELDHITHQARVVAFRDGTIMDAPAPWGRACYWTAARLLNELGAMLIPLERIHADALALDAAWDEAAREMDEIHGEALTLHLKREASQHRVLIITGGELHDWAVAPKADMLLNLSRMLRDPAHVPGEDMIELRGDVDESVREFVMSTPGAWELIEDMTATVRNTLDRLEHAKLIVHVLCRGGKHRAAAFGKTLHEELNIFGVDAVAHHLDAHLDRVIVGEKA